MGIRSKSNLAPLRVRGQKYYRDKFPDFRIAKLIFCCFVAYFEDLYCFFRIEYLIIFQFRRSYENIELLFFLIQFLSHVQHKSTLCDLNETCYCFFITGGINKRSYCKSTIAFDRFDRQVIKHSAIDIMYLINYNRIKKDRNAC